MWQMKVDPNEVLGSLSDVEKRQLPFAAALGLNRIGILGQQAQRKRVQSAFHLQREGFILQGIKIEKADRATKTSWSVVIRVQADRDFLNRMEDGGLKAPMKGRWLWKPNVEVFKGQVISRSNPLHPMNLRFDANMRGPLRTFMVHSNGRRNGPLILQRTGAASTGYNHTNMVRTARGTFDHQVQIKGQRKRKQGIRMLYQLVSRTRVPAKLEFVETIGNAVNANWSRVMNEAMDEAMRTAR